MVSRRGHPTLATPRSLPEEGRFSESGEVKFVLISDAVNTSLKGLAPAVISNMISQV